MLKTRTGTVKGMGTSLRPVDGVPRIALVQAHPGTGLWADTGGYRSDSPPPFWAFAWPGGVALARHVLDHPELVAGRRVLDVATGSGLVAVAAALAGAAHVVAADSDDDAVAAVRRNAEANGVADRVDARRWDVAHGDDAGDADVVLAGDAFYSAGVARAMLAFLRRAARGGADVLVSDPGRGFLPRGAFVEVSTMDVPVSAALEDATVARTTIWRLAAA
jgi:predicted nicotinamide N-methyase